MSDPIYPCGCTNADDHELAKALDTLGFAMDRDQGKLDPDDPRYDPLAIARWDGVEFISPVWPEQTIKGHPLPPQEWPLPTIEHDA